MSVQILLSSYNGEKFLKDQIESLRRQKNVELSILVRDDGSTDSTCEILKMYQEQGVLQWYAGKNLKSAYSFFDLMLHSDPADYYAFCDQDDYWLENKLEIAITALSKFETSKPALYFSKAQRVDEKLQYIDGGEYPTHALEFGNALLQNNVTGCTMVINRALLEKITTRIPDTVLMHDHWIYLVCSALNGNVVFDPNSYILYRQHANNVIGAKTSLTDKVRRSGLFDKKRIRSRIASELLITYSNELPEKNLTRLRKMVEYQNSLGKKWALMCDSEIKTGKRSSDLLLMLNILMNKV